MAHEDDAACEVDILDAQRQAFLQPQAGTVEQCTDQPVLWCNLRQQCCDFVARQNNRNMYRRPGTADFAHPRQVDAENFTIEKEDRRQSLLVCGGGDFQYGSQVREPGLDLGSSHDARMAQVVKADVAADPEQVGFFSSE